GECVGRIRSGTAPRQAGRPGWRGRRAGRHDGAGARVDERSRREARLGGGTVRLGAPLAIPMGLVLAARAAGQGGAPGPLAGEEDYYAVDFLVPPDGARVEAGGLAFLPDGRLVASTRRGQVWIVENPLARDPKDAKFHLFAEGLQEGLGLAVVDGQIV